MWLVDRFSWSNLRSYLNSARVELIPSAIAALTNVEGKEEAYALYWSIDGVAMNDDLLFEAAAPTVECLVLALPQSRGIGRKYLLDAIAQIGMGEPAESEIDAGNHDLRPRCMRAIGRGSAFYLWLVENGSDEEKQTCINILGPLAKFDSEIKGTVIWYLRRIESLLESDEQTKIEARNWLEELVP